MPLRKPREVGSWVHGFEAQSEVWTGDMIGKSSEFRCSLKP